MVLIIASPIPAYFLNTWTILPYADIRDITIKDSTNANIQLTGLDTVTVSNLHFERTSIKDVTILTPLFTFQVGHSLTMINVTAKDVYGPVLYALWVMNLNFTDCTFNNMSSSQDLENTKFQNILVISKGELPATVGLNPKNPDNTYLNNFNVNVRHLRVSENDNK